MSPNDTSTWLAASHQHNMLNNGCGHGIGTNGLATMVLMKNGNHIATQHHHEMQQMGQNDNNNN